MVIATEPMKNMDGIRAVFKLKGDNAIKPDMYLGALLSELETDNGKKCWTMSSEKYVKASVENVESGLAESDLRLPYRCDTPMSTSYHPCKDVTREMNAEGFAHLPRTTWNTKVGDRDL